MKTKKERPRIFLVLVPHRDVRLVLQNYSAALFKLGFPGAFHFPWAAPLAALSSPLNRNELKRTAEVIRESADRRKITAAQTGAVQFPAEESDAKLFGPRLELSEGWQDVAAAKATRLFLPPVIGCCLLENNEETPALLCPQLSFRAAAVANMFWQPLKSGCSGSAGYKWKIGKLRWLPPVRKD